MTIYLTKPSDLTAGLWWARQITGDRDLGRGPWLIVQVTGVLPFLSACVVLSRDMRGWREPEQKNGVINNPNEWEFGPRIDIPSDKGRAEYPPELMERNPTP